MNEVSDEENWLCTKSVLTASKDPEREKSRGAGRLDANGMMAERAIIAFITGYERATVENVMNVCG
jgi:hypothetical protein